MRDIERDLCALAAAAAKLPAGIPPEHDLWPGIRAAIERAQPAAPVPRAAWRRWGALAAALVLVSAAAVVAARFGRPAAPTVGATRSSAGAQLAAGGDYAAAVALLHAEIDSRRDDLAPGVVETLDRNLEIIDRAIGEIEATLTDSPRRTGRDRVLTALYQRKIHVLWTVARLTS